MQPIVDVHNISKKNLNKFIVPCLEKNGVVIIRNLFNIGLTICPPKSRPVIITETFDKAIEIIEYHRNLLSETT